MIIRLCTPIYTYSPIHFRKIDMTTKNSGGFIRFHLPLHSGGGWCRANECSIAFLHSMVQTQMKLQETYPNILEEIINGNLSVKQTAGTFSMLRPDQVIEQTINKEQKGAWGIIGINTLAVSVQLWILSSHVTAKTLGDLRESINLAQKINKPKDIGKKTSRLMKLLFRTALSWFSSV